MNKNNFPNIAENIEYLETTKHHCLFNFYVGNNKFRGKIFLSDIGGQIIRPRWKFGVCGYFYPLNNFITYLKLLKKDNLKKLTKIITFNVSSDLYKERTTNMGG